MYKWDGMIMGTIGRWEPLGVFENGVVFGEDKFHVGMNN
jgi:hypothetical protein